jgi:RimJ/RimL family protein N-acetyltransferase
MGMGMGMESTLARMALSAAWRAPTGRLVVREPARAEVACAAARLAGFYNDPHNRSLLAHEHELAPSEVLEHYELLWADGGVPLWLEHEGVLVGDADLRHVRNGVAETAILVGDRSLQGRGFGSRYNLMVHALAFRALGLTRIYATIIPQNHASQRIFAKLGYAVDASPAARAYVDAATDVALSLPRERFEALHAATLAELVVEASP